jgi:Domain of unknown function (DUF4823)
MRCWMLGLITLMLAGCADSHEVIRSQVATTPLSREASAYVALPADGSYGEIAYQGSGAQTARAVAAAFAPYLREIQVADRHQSIDAARRSAEERDHQYVLYPEILHWEDRATEWSGKPDVISINLSVIRADSGVILDRSLINGKSGLATFGGDHPQDLLPPILEEYSATLFR